MVQRVRFPFVSALVALAGACTGAPWDKPRDEPAKCDPSKDRACFASAQLDAPPAGQGWQWTSGEFEVEQGEDLQQCFFIQVPGAPGEEVYVNRFQIVQNSGTHHMNVFRVKTQTELKAPDQGGAAHQVARNGVGPCFQSSNWADWPLVVNSQEAADNEWQLPEGVAEMFHGGDWLMMQSHYVNAATQKTSAKGSVYVNFWTTPKEQVQHEVGSLFATKQSIRVCQSDAAPKFSGTCQFNSPVPVTIIGANGHFHSRGRVFEMFAWDGRSQEQPPESDKFYRSEAWDEPPMMRSPQLMQTIPAGGGIFYTCQFEWQPPPMSILDGNNIEQPFGCAGLNLKDQEQLGTPAEAMDCCYTFGGPVDWGEHCNNFIYFYPKVDNIICY